jgi:hypothetical protein
VQHTWHALVINQQRNYNSSLLNVEVSCANVLKLTVNNAHEHLFCSSVTHVNTETSARNVGFTCLFFHGKSLAQAMSPGRHCDVANINTYPVIVTVTCDCDRDRDALIHACTSLRILCSRRSVLILKSCT